MSNSEAPAVVVLYPDNAWALTPEPSDSPEQVEYVRRDIFDVYRKAVDAILCEKLGITDVVKLANAAERWYIEQIEQALTPTQGD
jgi:hypothetical protein